MINWEQEFDVPAFVEGGSHLAKSDSTVQYLYDLDETHGDDVVLMSDCYAAWVQLRPQIIVDRYSHLNSRTNDRLDLFFGQQQRRANWYSPGHHL